MNDTRAKSLFDSRFGICVKDLQKKVLYQNQRCIDRCGNKMGSICTEGCVKDYHPMNGDVPMQGCHILKHLPSLVPGIEERVETVIINDGEQILTFQCPVERKIETILNICKQYGVTISEKKILSLKISGYSNREIASLLNISHATLKTHLNNLRKKIPTDLLDG